MSSPSFAKRIAVAMPAARARRPRVWRWGAVLVAVLALHWIAAQWIERHRDTFAPVEAERAPVEIALLTPQPIERKPATAARHPAAAPRASKPRATGEHVLTATQSATTTTTTAGAASEPIAASGAAVASAASAAGAGNAVAAQANPGVKFSVPPSGDLDYDTFYNGVQNQPGTIHWTSNGQSYEMIVSVPLPFVGTYSYSSHGRVDAFGLAPDQYIEKRGRRAEDVTLFNRAAKQIAFTRTPQTLALPDGAQDRFSIVMQLAALVRGDPGAYTPGVTRQFYVADNDSGEIWPLETIGDETVRTRAGFVGARHFMRLARRDGDRRRIDVWLAPSLGWLPARLVQTEPNGTQIELVWRGRLAEPGAENAAGANEAADLQNAPPAAGPDVNPPRDKP
jgi:hypothetical protein